MCRAIIFLDKKRILMKKFLLFAVAIGMLCVTACVRDEPAAVVPPSPSNEYITTVQLTYQNVAIATDNGIATWKKLDPENPNTLPDTSAAILRLKKGANYTLAIAFLDQTKTPAVAVTDDIRARANYHFICLTPLNGLGITATATDYDTNKPPLPLGLSQNIATSTNLANGRFNLRLKHQPNLKTGACEPGSADVDVNFSVTVQ